jgi:plasmid stabilization system protein ParE
MKIIFSAAAAKADLREITLFIARDNKLRARSFVRELQG